MEKDTKQYKLHLVRHFMNAVTMEVYFKIGAYLKLNREKARFLGK